ncbi:MAG: hypothetical protein A2X17_04605 [Bacteroidetes bacterium GWF2_41_61]|jgi:ribosome maturation factor RimP|nr:MAG: hypothetical protein A2X20_01790 [Bacteroidetes bacterium GWE2_40_15]OFY28451.1 MAG: hypothetical protein A2X17_04605 [Bacteroidetes bacterium GWF2_41_61]OFY91842.1 MAG: hypothetical protein A2266_02365 [Bacteroidetes bacterium RIFOXYA12_FULL_40_10]PKP06541.1 MAG: ribosome assembly cofactor RimP [Bacteroidetes bacterium HGW-Bacteroidetes-5]HBG24739.1 ribosome assembly cofactor RimP [Rikenellaceae bacterium]
MIIKEKIATLIEGYLADNSLFLVDITISSENDIEIAIDSYDRVDIKNCADISRIVDAGLNREEEDFSLTVTSAGLDQPYKVFDQYKKSLGKEVVVVLKSGAKIVATLTRAFPDKIELTYSRQERVEGKKRRETVEIVETYNLCDIKSTKTQINFK